MMTKDNDMKKMMMMTIYEEVEEKAPVKKSVWDTPAKMHKNQTKMEKDSKPSTPGSKGQESFKKTGKNT